MAYGIIRTDLMSGTTVAADLVNIKYQVSGTDTAIENGNVVKVGSLATGESNVFIGGAPAANTPIDEVVVIASVELMADERKRNLNEFRNEAGEISRGYRLRSGGIYSITAECLTGTDIAVGNIVELQAGTKFKAVASLTSGSTQVGTIIDIVGDYYGILIK